LHAAGMAAGACNVFSTPVVGRAREPCVWNQLPQAGVETFRGQALDEARLVAQANAGQIDRQHIGAMLVGRFDGHAHSCKRADDLAFTIVDQQVGQGVTRQFRGIADDDLQSWRWSFLSVAFRVRH